MLDICLDYLSVISSDMLDISCLNTQFFFNIVEIERGKNTKKCIRSCERGLRS